MASFSEEPAQRFQPEHSRHSDVWSCMYFHGTEFGRMFVHLGGQQSEWISTKAREIESGIGGGEGKESSFWWNGRQPKRDRQREWIGGEGCDEDFAFGDFISRTIHLLLQTSDWVSEKEQSWNVWVERALRAIHTDYIFLVSVCRRQQQSCSRCQS